MGSQNPAPQPDNSLLDEINSISHYFPYRTEPTHAEQHKASVEKQQRREVQERADEGWAQHRKEILDNAADNDVVNLQGHRASIYDCPPRKDERDMPLSNLADAPPPPGKPCQSVIVPWDSLRLKADLVRIISQWLADEGFGATRQSLLEEAGIKLREREDGMAEFRKLRTYLLEGNWSEVDKLCSKPLLKNHKAFLYAIFKQQFLEHIEHREFQKAFTFLSKRLKPLEHYQPHAAEFGDLCYLLSAKSVTDAPSFRSWEGIQPAREALVAEFSPILECGGESREDAFPGAGLDQAVTSPEARLMALSGADGTAPGYYGKAGSQDSSQSFVPPHRLQTLLYQAMNYQVEFARYHSHKVPVVSSLLQDYSGFIVPNRCRNVLRGHNQNVKCARFVGELGHKVVSGSSDCTLRLWDTESGNCEAIYEGHGSRIWDVDSPRDGSLIASASADSTVKLWSTTQKSCQMTLLIGTGDVYCCRFAQDQDRIVTGGYDKIVRLYDVNTGTAVRMFAGHQLGISSAVFSPLGNVVATGAKDTSIRFWDTLSGLCIRMLPGHLGEVTSIEMSEDGLQLLTSSKDNSTRLWDMRMLRPLQRFKGNQNTSKNFIRSSFAHPSLVVSGSEDGLVYMWDQESPSVLQTLEGHGTETVYDGLTAAPDSMQMNGGGVRMDMPPSAQGLRNTRQPVVVYSAVWNKVQGILASCADDGTVRLWDWSPPPRNE